jgi:hypothetical protein
MKPLVSIVIPAYKVQRYIEDCVRSVLAQLQDHHELIVVDDGSPDNTLALVNALRDSWPGSNFHVLSQANEGIAGARNHCVRAARGEYIAFVDSDDILLAGSLALLDQTIAKHHPDVVCFDFRMWHPSDPGKTRDVALGYPTNTLICDQQQILNTFLSDRYMYVWANVIKREIYGQLPDPVFPPGRVFEDVSTLARLLSQCTSLVHVPHKIIDYRQHPASITQSVSEKWCMDFAAALPVARQHLIARGVSDSVRQHFDVTAAWFYIGVVKNTYQLPAQAGRRARAAIKQSFVDNLFGDCDSMLAAMHDPAFQTLDRKADLLMLGQVRNAMSGNLVFHMKQSASRKFKMWRHNRKLRRHMNAQALPTTL